MIGNSMLTDLMDQKDNQAVEYEIEKMPKSTTRNLPGNMIKMNVELPSRALTTKNQYLKVNFN